MARPVDIKIGCLQSLCKPIQYKLDDGEPEISGNKRYTTGYSKIKRTPIPGVRFYTLLVKKSGESSPSKHQINI
ncbi:MAG: hypothetical protein AAB116_00750 [Candidatus Poribacteria bacterium]